MGEIVVDLFAGPGGWDEGARLAEFAGFLVGIEHDLSACRTAVAAGHPRIQADVSTYPLEPFVGKVDGLIGSPPCPTFSPAGQGGGRHVLGILATAMTRTTRGHHVLAETRRQCAAVLRVVALVKFPKLTRAERSAWARNQAVISALVLQPLRWILATRPRWIALEQVPAVLPLWRHMAELLRETGYRAWYGQLSAEQYGVPQTRKRAILTARRDGLPVGPPMATHQAYVAGKGHAVEPDLFGDLLPPPISMAQALGFGLPDQPAPVVMTARGRQGGAEDVLRGSSWRADWWRRQIAAGNWTARMHPAGVHGSYGYSREASAPSPTIKGSGSGGQYWTVDRPATTVCADARLAPPGHRDREGGERQFGEDTVRVTVEEAGVLQSFPADYPWQGTKTKRYEQVGNAVPPLLAAAVLAPLISSTGERAA